MPNRGEVRENSNKQISKQSKYLLSKMTHTDYEQMIMQIKNFNKITEEELSSTYLEYYSIQELMRSDRYSLEQFINILQSNDLDISHVETTVFDDIRLVKSLDKVRVLFLYLQEHSNEFVYRENITLNEFRLIIEELKQQGDTK